MAETAPATPENAAGMGDAAPPAPAAAAAPAPTAEAAAAAAAPAPESVAEPDTPPAPLSPMSKPKSEVSTFSFDNKCALARASGSRKAHLQSASANHPTTQ